MISTPCFTGSLARLVIFSSLKRAAAHRKRADGCLMEKVLINGRRSYSILLLSVEIISESVDHENDRKI